MALLIEKFYLLSLMFYFLKPLLLLSYIGCSLGYLSEPSVIIVLARPGSPDFSLSWVTR
jgi:hypothetical protein